MPEYDCIIIGSGPAGLTAGLYAARAGMKVLLLEKAACGGQMLWTELIENFPGFPEGAKGAELAERMRAQAVKAGVQLITEEVKQVAAAQSPGTFQYYNVKTQQRDYSSYSIILACGAYPRRLGVPKEEALTGRGVSYCATCDGPLFRGREVVVIGGGNAACEEALFLSKFARKVALVHRRDKLRADQVFQDRLKANPKIELIWNSQVLEILGEDKVTGVKIKNKIDAKEKEISCAGVFIFVGLRTDTDFVQDLVKKDAQGFVVTDNALKTSSSGIFACGDCRVRALQQIITACSEGAEAAVASRNYVEQLKKDS